MEGRSGRTGPARGWPAHRRLAAMGGTRDSAARRSVYGSRALWSIQIWPCMGGARAGHPSASGCGRRWRARPYSKGNSKWSVQASAGFILKSRDRLHWNPNPSDFRRMCVAIGVLPGPIWTRFNLARWMSALRCLRKPRIPRKLIGGALAHFRGVMFFDGNYSSSILRKED